MSDKKLDEMKEEYGNIKIPDDLKDKVLHSIEQAKTETELLQKDNLQTKETSKRENRTILIFIKRTVQIAAGLLIVITVAANTNAGIANAMEEIPLVGAIARVVTFRNYEVKGENVEANIKVPTVEEITEGGANKQETGNATQQINKSVEEYTNQIIAQFEADVAEFAEYEGEDGAPHEAVFSNYEVITDTDSLFSLRINTTISKGGSANMSKIYHIDKKTNSVISLKDIFKEGVDYSTPISENMKEQMRSNMASDENLIYFLDNEEGMNEWDFKAIKEDQTFYINSDNKLTIVFDEYEVAPGYMGTVEFCLPTEILNDIVKEGYLK